MRVSVLFVNNNRVAFLRAFLVLLLIMQSPLKFTSEIYKCQLQCSGGKVCSV